MQCLLSWLNHNLENGKTPTLIKKRDLTLYILPWKSQSSFNRVSVSNLEVTDRQTDRYTLGIIILVKD